MTSTVFCSVPRAAKTGYERCTKALGVFCVLIAAASCQPRSDPSSTARPPVRLPPIPLSTHEATPLGLIVITVDTLRADYLSCYGHTRVLTPGIDRIASGGQLFANAISQATTTTPAHASLFTGLYLQDHNVYSNFEALGDQPKTMAEIFKEAGFSTFGLVNMRHLNPEIGNLGQGFDHFVRSGFMRRAGPSFDLFLKWLDHRGSAKDGEKDQPFFAWLHLADVHTPYRPPPPYDRFYYDDDENDPNKHSLARIWPLLPEHMSDHPFFLQWLEGITDLDWVYAQYQGAVTYVDDEIGRLLDELERRELLHRTAVVFTADHGESLGEHNMYFVHSGLYEPTIRIPLITYFPGANRRGVQIDNVVQQVDVLPTVLEYFDIASPKGIRGRSLAPLIRGELEPNRIALIEHAGKSMVALRSDRYKYIKHLRNLSIQPGYPFVEGKEELYDLQRDPGETTDLSAERPDVLVAFRRELERRRGVKLALQTGGAAISSETEAVLRILGYVR